MITTRKVEPVGKEIMEEVGFGWHTDDDGTPYIIPELVPVTPAEAEDYYEASNALYEMFIEAGQHIIDNDLFEEIGIPENLVEMIKASWDDDDWHLYGRFDLAGGIDGQPIKLIEFNADTPTSLFETAIIQWAVLKMNKLDEESQFNNIYESIRDNFKRMITEDDGLDKFDEYYNNESILFSAVRDLPEDEQTTRLLEKMAQDAGFKTSFCYMDQVGFLEQGGVYNEDDERFDMWFKLWPWENIAADEPELTDLLSEIANNRKSVIINPAYTLLFQSKGILKILYDLFPDSPYLLPTSYEPLEGVKQVVKPIFGREGENITILSENGDVEQETAGEYDHHPVIYQAFVEFPKDEKGDIYQAGVFYAWEGCGLGFRRGNEILDNMASFVGHIIQE
jgi:glutathionylspermidine synthase